MNNMSYMDPEVVMRSIMPAGAQGLEKMQEAYSGAWPGAAMGKAGKKKTD